MSSIFFFQDQNNLKANLNFLEQTYNHKCFFQCNPSPFIFTEIVKDVCSEIYSSLERNELLETTFFQEKICRIILIKLQYLTLNTYLRAEEIFVVFMFLVKSDLTVEIKMRKDDMQSQLLQIPKIPYARFLSELLGLFSRIPRQI